LSKPNFAISSVRRAKSSAQRIFILELQRGLRIGSSLSSTVAWHGHDRRAGREVQPAEPANPVQKQDFSGADLNGSKYAFAWRLFTPMVGLAAQYGSRCISRYGLAEVITLNLIALVPA
jgi:hypothetical protein